MENTIKKDLERITVGRMLLDDNTLLEYVLDRDMKIYLYARFIEGPTRTLREHFLVRMSLEDYFDFNNHLVEINDAKNAVAIFKPVDHSLQLDRVYEADKHQFATPEFLDLVYKERFPKQPLNKEFKKKKKQ